jgi:oligopeptidase A
MPRRTWPTCAPSPLKQLGLADPQAWDWPYIGEKLKEARYAFSEQEVKQYFTAPKVLAGCSRSSKRCLKSPSAATLPRCGTLGGVLPHRARARSWWASSTWTRPPAPASAAAPGWTTCARAGCARHRQAADARGPPGVQLCRRRGRQAALLTHDDVTTLFHEFGHGLHHMLTQVNERDVSGISGVEWDAVELPSQFMENFCWEWDVLRHMTAHVDTGEPLPRALFDKMLAAKNFQSGMQTLRQIEFALFDMLLHTEHDPAQDFMPLLDRCAQRWPSCSRQPSAARRTPSAISLPAAMRRATTATSGPRC